ncbi:hypothetical protein LPJ76_004508 [Coemansia sp. RSA 638]|nr:hypothetical protein LPJ76_004508 [Coemansia sp. RSA 638]
MELATLILYWLLGTALYAADAAVPVTTTISISGGLLIKNGKQTSCEIVPIVEPGKAVDAGIVIGGDLYAVEDREAEAATASDEDASVDTQTPPVLTTHSAINSDNPELNSANDENNSRSGLSTGAIVGIAIGVSVLVIILLVFVVRWVLIATKKQREEKYWDNEMENMKSAMSLGQHGQAEPA